MGRDGVTAHERVPVVSDTAWSPATPDPAAGSAFVDVQLPGYREFVLIARGGESLVYRARQDALDRLVAVKVLTGHESSSAPGSHGDSLRWFQRELEITMRLGRAHPNIVTVLDTGVTGAGEPCIVMEYYELGSLHDQLRAYGRLPAGAATAAGAVVADALTYAHGQGVLHRDVKPHNILVLPTSYVLADFGLARPTGADRSASLELFSYRHAAPQVLDGELPVEVDDIYSLGSTLFTLLDGRPPFASDDRDADSALAYLRRVRTGSPRPIVDTDASPELLKIIGRCLARRRAERFPDAASLRDALAGVATGAGTWVPAAVRPTSTPTSSTPSALSDTAVPSAASATLVSSPPAVPQARSAIEHLEEPTDPPVRSGTDGDIDGSDPTGQPPDPLAELAPPPRPGWPRFAVRALAALLFGGLLGLAGSWIVTAARPDGTTTLTNKPAPTISQLTLPPTSAALSDDASIAPRLTTVEDRGSSVEVRWVDQSNGTATFFVIGVNGDDRSPLRRVNAGTTGTVIDGLDPTATHYCFEVLALTDTAKGTSETGCTPTRGRPD